LSLAIRFVVSVIVSTAGSVVVSATTKSVVLPASLVELRKKKYHIPAVVMAITIEANTPTTIDNAVVTLLPLSIIVVLCTSIIGGEVIGDLVGLKDIVGVDIVGSNVGEEDAPVGDFDGVTEGRLEGKKLGLPLSVLLGVLLGANEGTSDCSRLGGTEDLILAVGVDIVGSNVGEEDGRLVSKFDGVTEGRLEGEILGFPFGVSLCVLLGANEGACDCSRLG